MKAISCVLAVAALFAASGADAQSTVRVRGTITAVDGSVMAVKSRDGRDLNLQLPDNVTVAVAKAVRFDDIKDGDYVGATTTPGPDGTAIASEVHYLAPTTQEGQSASDLAPGSTMTNANVASKVVGTGKHELTLQFKNGTQKIVVPDEIPLVRSVPGTRADLVPGEYVFAVVQVATDGTMTAPRIQVSKDGVRPGQ